MALLLPEMSKPTKSGKQIKQKSAKSAKYTNYSKQAIKKEITKVIEEGKKIRVVLKFKCTRARRHESINTTL